MNQNLKHFLVGVFFSLPFWWGVNIFEHNLENAFYADISEPLENIILVQVPTENKFPELDIQAQSVLSVKINKFGKKKILFSKNSNLSFPIASLTKLMTAVIVLENTNYSFIDTIVISKTAAEQGNIPNYGNLDNEKGKKFTIEELLDLMLIYSSNDAAWALSEVMGTNDFIQKMNQKAQDLELTDTYFVNPTGLDPKDFYYNSNNLKYFNYSTVKDLVKLTQYILKDYHDPLIFKISLKKGPYPIENGISNLLLAEGQTILGGKTGYTRKVGGSVLLVFQNEKEEIFINVILGAESEETRLEGMQKLINWLGKNHK